MVNCVMTHCHDDDFGGLCTSPEAGHENLDIQMGFAEVSNGLLALGMSLVGQGSGCTGKKAKCKAEQFGVEGCLWSTAEDNNFAALLVDQLVELTARPTLPNSI